MILKVDIHVRDDVYPMNGRDRLRRKMQTEITRVVNEQIDAVAAELKKIEYTRGKA